MDRTTCPSCAEIIADHPLRSATIVLVLVLVLILSAVLPSPAGAAWVSSVAATTVLTGPGQLALLPSGRAAVAYAASSLVYQEETASGFVRTVIDESCINSFSISVDASGEPAIAYCSVGELRFAHRVAGTFLIDRPEGATTTCAHVSLAHDPSGRPGIAYRGSGGMRYLGFNGTAWDAVAVSLASGTDTSLGFSSTGAPAIAFKYVPAIDPRRATQVLYLATRPSAAWSVATIAIVASRLGFLTSPSLAFNALDEPAVAYATGNNTCQTTIRVYEPTGTSIIGPTSCSPRVSLARTPGGDLVVAHERVAGTIALESRTGSTWLQEDVRTGAREPRLVIDTAATPRVLAITLMDSRVEISTRNGSWSTVVVDVDGSALLSPSLAVSGTLPAVSFGTGSDTLEVSRFDGASWTREIIDASTGSGYGESSLAAFPASPLLGIAYSLPASNNGAIRYAQSDGLSVSVEEIVPNGAQRYVSLALDGAGRPAIAYSLTGSGALQLARFDGTLWSSSQVSSLSAGAVSLAFDPTGQPAIAYHETGAELRIALFDGTTWTDTAVAVTGTSLKPSLAFDPAGRASIAYFDQTAASVMLAEDDGSGFVTTTVQSGVISQMRSVDLVLGPGAMRQIAIASTKGLDIARGVPGNFTIEPVAVSALAAEIALDAQGETYMAYAAPCRGRILVATEATSVNLLLLRKRLADVLPGWKLAAFPLTTGNDDEQPPFPLAVLGPGSSLDPIASGAEPIVLYTDTDSSASGNALRLAKSGSGVRIAY